MTTQYTYDAATGVFATAAGVVTVPAATFTQDAATGAYSTTPGTVPYTHLDVSKRQVIHQLNVGIQAAAAGDVLDPVSYTHLDVYKRQAMLRPRVRMVCRPSLSCRTSSGVLP